MLTSLRIFSMLGRVHRDDHLGHRDGVVVRLHHVERGALGRRGPFRGPWWRARRPRSASAPRSPTGRCSTPAPRRACRRYVSKAPSKKLLARTGRTRPNRLRRHGVAALTGSLPDSFVLLDGFPLQPRRHQYLFGVLAVFGRTPAGRQLCSSNWTGFVGNGERGRRSWWWSRLHTRSP